MTKPFLVEAPAGNPEPPYLFQDLPTLPADDLGHFSRITNDWRLLVADGRLQGVIAEIFQKYCRVRAFDPPELLVKLKSGEHRTLSVEKSPFRIGRKKDNDLELPEMGVSGHHAQIRKEGAQWVLLDEGSVNGTTLNGKELEKRRPYTVENGDVAHIMDTEILIRFPKPTVRHAELDLSFDSLDRRQDLPPADDLTEALIGVKGSEQLLGVYVPTHLVRSWLESMVRIWYAQESIEIPLSDVEKGLYEFLLLKFLHQVHAVLFDGEGDAFYLVAVNSPALKLQTLGEAAALRFLGRFECSTGEILLLLPDPGAEGWVGPLDKYIAATGGRRVELMRSQIAPWTWCRISLAVMATAIELSPADLVSLEPGDVVLLPADAPQFDEDGHLTGPVTLLLQGGRKLRARAELTFTGGRYELVFREFYEHQTDSKGEAHMTDQEQDQKVDEQEQPQEEQKAATPPAETPAEADNLEESGELMQELNLTMVVELDRIQVTLADLIRLLPGQVLQLNRLPTEPVSLSVEGRIIGRGQLVKIKDEIGVKILTLKK
ncbi:MAG: FliM/FliN family flagellar motor switch protein [Acidobacteria bacterium]|nr:FliM/FliN family flagellar motor switch protein [Acidobacteriota bacterium]